MATVNEDKCFWVDSASFIDTGSLLVKEATKNQVVFMRKSQNFGQTNAFSPAYNRVPGKFMRITTKRPGANERRQVSSKSSSLARAGDEKGARLLF